MSGLTGTTYRTKLVHMENNIQKARDVLAKWRKSHAWFPAPWAIRHEEPGRAAWSDVVFDAQGDSLFTYDEPGGDEFSPTHDAGTDPVAAALIVGTAGNPEHLEPVTAYENLLRADNAMTRNMARTHCRFGHPFAGDNIYRAPKKPSWRRECALCHRSRHKALKLGLTLDEYFENQEAKVAA